MSGAYFRSRGWCRILLPIRTLAFLARGDFSVASISGVLDTSAVLPSLAACPLPMVLAFPARELPAKAAHLVVVQEGKRSQNLFAPHGQGNYDYSPVLRVFRSPHQPALRRAVHQAHD